MLSLLCLETVASQRHELCGKVLDAVNLHIGWQEARGAFGGDDISIAICCAKLMRIIGLIAQPQPAV